MNSEHYNQNKSLRPPPLADHHHTFSSANGSSLAYNNNNMGGQINPLFFPPTNSTFLNVAQKLPHDTLEAMLASKQLARGGSLQLIGDFEGGGEGHGANTSQEDERIKRQGSFSNPRSNYKGEGTNNNNNMYIDLGGGSRGGGEEAHTLNMDYMNMHMDEGVEYIDGDLGEHMKKGGVLGTTTRRLGYEQVKALEKAFEVENRLEPERKVKLASQLGLQPRQVAVWFQNRRARWKTKQMERDYTVLKNKFEALKADRDKLIQEKDQLQAELSRLKGHDMEDKKVGDQDSPTLASCSLVDDASHQVNVEDQGHVGKESLDEKLENDSLSRTEDSGNVNGDIEDSSSMLQGQSSLKPANNEETDLYNHHNNHWRLGPSQSYYKNNIKNEEWENGEQGPLNMPMEWYHNW